MNYFVLYVLFDLLSKKEVVSVLYIVKVFWYMGAKIPKKSDGVVVSVLFLENGLVLICSKILVSDPPW